MNRENAILALAAARHSDDWSKDGRSFYVSFTAEEIDKMAARWTLRQMKRKDGSVRVTVSLKPGVKP